MVISNFRQIQSSLPKLARGGGMKEQEEEESDGKLKAIKVGAKQIKDNLYEITYIIHNIYGETSLPLLILSVETLQEKAFNPRKLVTQQIYNISSSIHI